MENRTTRQNRREQVNDWLGDEDEPQTKNFPLNLPSNLLDGQKHPIKQHKITVVEKTQRIKKPKKQERKASAKKDMGEGISLEDKLVSEAVDRLREYHSAEKTEKIPIYKRLTKQRLLQFLEIIQTEYSRTVKQFLAGSSQQSCGSLKRIFLHFLDKIIDAFPVLNNIVFSYAFRYYTSGMLQYRFNKLMDKNITPILKLMSEKYNKSQTKEFNFSQSGFQTSSTHVSQSPERECIEEFDEEDMKKAEKNRRKRNKRKENRNRQTAIQKEQQEKKQTNQQGIQVEQKKPSKIEVDNEVIQLNKYIDNLTLDENRVECRIQQTYLEKWNLEIKKYANSEA